MGVYLLSNKMGDIFVDACICFKNPRKIKKKKRQRHQWKWLSLEGWGEECKTSLGLSSFLAHWILNHINVVPRKNKYTFKNHSGCFVESGCRDSRVEAGVHLESHRSSSGKGWRQLALEGSRGGEKSLIGGIELMDLPMDQGQHEKEEKRTRS